MTDNSLDKLSPYSTKIISVAGNRFKAENTNEGSTVDITASLGEARELIFIVRGMIERFMLHQHKEIKLGRFNPIQRKTNELDLTPYGATDRGVTRFHARIHIENNRLFITDMDSTNGTYMGGVKVPANTPTLLRKGDELMLGQLPIQIMYRWSRDNSSKSGLSIFALYERAVYFLEGEKNEAYVMTLVERASSYVVGGAVGLDCGQNQWQAILDTAPSATLYYSDGEWLKMWVRDKIVSWLHVLTALKQYVKSKWAWLPYSDACPTYLALVYTPGIHIALPNKNQTYRVEGMNAELRHYLVRLARRSRCFSRCLDSLSRAVKLFVYAWNRRQLFHLAHPTYPVHVMHFIYPWS